MVRGFLTNMTPPLEKIVVLTVRCFLCGEHAVRLIMGGRQILHARCQACRANVLAEVVAIEQDTQRTQPEEREREITAEVLPAVSREDAPEALEASQ